MTVETLLPGRYGQLQHVEEKNEQASNNKNNFYFFQAELLQVQLNTK
jgi:hypothetical protein